MIKKTSFKDQLLKMFSIWCIFFVLLFSPCVWGEEGPDELYRTGRFSEAAEAYARLDMDHPKDLRYRFNRGCSAYQGMDYKGSMASFSSVVRRTKDRELKFKANFNLGNTAFKQGDFGSAVTYYKKAALSNPENDDVRHNLELALRELGKQQKKEKESPQQDNKSNQDSSRQDEQGDKQEKGKEEKKNQKADEDQNESGQDKEPEKKADPGRGEGQKNEDKSPDDLSGDLKTNNPLPKEKTDAQALSSPMSKIDKKKAEALLDNIKEDRSRFLRFQVPEGKERGVRSGKDW